MFTITGIIITSIIIGPSVAVLCILLWKHYLKRDVDLMWTDHEGDDVP